MWRRKQIHASLKAENLVHNSRFIVEHLFLLSIPQNYAHRKHTLTDMFLDIWEDIFFLYNICRSSEHRWSYMDFIGQLFEETKLRTFLAMLIMKTYLCHQFIFLISTSFRTYIVCYILLWDPSFFFLNRSPVVKTQQRVMWWLYNFLLNLIVGDWKYK